METSVTIGGRRVGAGSPCFVIAEAGSNHNGSLAQAKHLIDAAVAARADAVKFQLFRADSLYPKTAGVSDYLKQAEPIFDIIQKMEMPESWVAELAGYCRARKILFLASVFDEALVEVLDEHVCAFKVASYEMTHTPLLKYVAGRRKPIIISTGTASLAEVQQAVATLTEAGANEIVVLQCTAAYPAPLESLNVRAIPRMRQALGLPVGFSDHSRDAFVGPMSAVALGANLIEKHFTLSNALPGPDHKFALEPDELAAMVRGIRDVELALGSGEKVMQPVEEELFHFARRAVFATRDIAPGDVLSTGNTAVLRRGRFCGGLAPGAYTDILGRRARKAVAASSLLQADDIGEIADDAPAR